jgi:hypothetical protein
MTDNLLIQKLEDLGYTVKVKHGRGDIHDRTGDLIGSLELLGYPDAHVRIRNCSVLHDTLAEVNIRIADLELFSDEEPSQAMWGVELLKFRSRHAPDASTPVLVLMNPVATTQPRQR